jgi:DHA3 family multidrug efflux protein-like MFS transporter
MTRQRISVTLIALGVDGLITNYPDRARTVMAQGRYAVAALRQADPAAPLHRAKGRHVSFTRTQGRESQTGRGCRCVRLSRELLMEPRPSTPEDTGVVDAAADATGPVAPPQDDSVVSDPTAPHHEAHLPPGVTRGPATVRSFRMVLLNTLVANVTTSYLWFALTFWAYLETRSVMATAIIGGAFMLFIAISGMYFGTLVDRHRKKPIMVVSSIVTFGAFVLAGIVAWLFPDSALIDWTGPIFWVFVLIILAGAVIESLRNIALSTTVTLLIPADDRDKANGLVGTVQGVAFMVTSVFSGLSIGFLGMHWTLVVAIVLTGICRWPTCSSSRSRSVQPADRGGRKEADLRHRRGNGRRSVAVPRSARADPLRLTFNNLVGGVFMALMDPYGLELFDVKVLGCRARSDQSSASSSAVGSWPSSGSGPRPLRTLLHGQCRRGRGR